MLKEDEKSTVTLPLEECHAPTKPADFDSNKHVPLTQEKQDKQPTTQTTNNPEDLETLNTDTTGLNTELLDPLEDEFTDLHYNLKSALESLSPSNVGLTCLPIQKQSFIKRRGASFTMMLAGESGLGKTSFINTLFDSSLVNTGDSDDLKENISARDNTRVTKTTEIALRRLVLDESGFELRLTCLDTPGFGDYINNRYCWFPIVKYVDEQYRNSIYKENQPMRKNDINGQIHACLYFISPTANSVTPLNETDIECMKNLSSRVNLIPIISKADGITSLELKAFKKSIRNVLKEQNIEICSLIDHKYRFQIIKDMPYSLINSIEYHENFDGEMVRGRKYKWGVAEVENPKHCDFIKLRELLMGSNMADLILSTETYFENYRKEFMSYRLDKSLKLAVDDTLLNNLNIDLSHVKLSDNNNSITSNNDSYVSTGKQALNSRELLTVTGANKSLLGGHGSNVDNLVDSQNSITILTIMNQLSLLDTEKELVELNPEYLELETKMKKKFTEIVQNQNQKFKDWKKALYERQATFNKDIENIHKRVVKLQDEIREHRGLNSNHSVSPVKSAMSEINEVSTTIEAR